MSTSPVPIPRIRLPRQLLQALRAQRAMPELLFHHAREAVHAAPAERIARRHRGELRAVPQLACGIDERAEAHPLAGARAGGLYVYHVAQHDDSLADVVGHFVLEDGWGVVRSSSFVVVSCPLSVVSCPSGIVGGSPDNRQLTTVDRPRLRAFASSRLRMRHFLACLASWR